MMTSEDDLHTMTTRRTANSQSMDVTGNSNRRLFWLSATLTLLGAVISIAFSMGRRSAITMSIDSVGTREFSNQATVSIVGKDGQVKPSKATTEERPPLSSLIREEDGQIIGDVQFLLDFAIIGHAKTATSALLHWLGNHEEVQMYDHEIHSLKNNKPDELVSLMYALPEGQYKRGYKSPNDIVLYPAMEAIRTYWPKTKLVIGVRHPVKWFESFYNFNTRQGNKLPPAETMVGKKSFDKSKYHEHLAMLGKTPMVSKNEYELLGLDRIVTPPLMTNKIFLYEVSQPFDKNDTRVEMFCKDLTDFIGLQRPLVPIKARTSEGNYHFAIDICNDTFIELRAELMAVGRNASKWIGTYFIDHPDVTVSSPEHFKNDILASWLKDPCDAQT